MWRTLFLFLLLQAQASSLAVSGKVIIEQEKTTPSAQLAARSSQVPDYSEKLNKVLADVKRSLATQT